MECSLSIELKMKGLILTLLLCLTFEYIHGALIGYELQSPEGHEEYPKAPIPKTRTETEDVQQNKGHSEKQMVHPMMVYKEIKVRHKAEKSIEVKSTFKIWFKKFKIFLEDLA